MDLRELSCPDDVELLITIVATYSDEPEHLAAIRAQLGKELSEAGDNRHVFVGVGDDMVVATIQLIVGNADNDPDLADGRQVAHLHNLQVRSELQGQGIGRAMMHLIENQARKMDKTTLTLGVDDNNDRAIHLYKKCGYQVFKIEPGREPGERCLLMSKRL